MPSQWLAEGSKSAGWQMQHLLQAACAAHAALIVRSIYCARSRCSLRSIGSICSMSSICSTISRHDAPARCPSTMPARNKHVQHAQQMQTRLLSFTADMYVVLHSRHVFCLTQQTCLLVHTADVSVASHSRHVCCLTRCPSTMPQHDANTMPQQNTRHAASAAHTAYAA